MKFSKLHLAVIVLALVEAEVILASPEGALEGPEVLSRADGVATETAGQWDVDSDSAQSSLTAALIDMKLLPPTEQAAESNAQYGYAISISNNRAVVGAPFAGGRGLAYILEETGDGWELESELSPEGLLVGSRFGSSVSMGRNQVLIGAPFDGEVVGERTGAAYVFEFDGIEWIEAAQLRDPLANEGDQFGSAVAISDDWLFIGSPRDVISPFRSGSVLAFQHDGGVWRAPIRVGPDDPSASSFFGYSLSLSGDRVVIGAPRWNGVALNSGAAYIFEYDGVDWRQSERLNPPDGEEDDFFGHSVSLHLERILVGAYGRNVHGENSGAAYVFDRDDSGVWIQSELPAPAETFLSAKFGSAVALEGDRAVIGAAGGGEYRGVGADSGAVYVYAFDSGQWQMEATLAPDDGEALDYFGHAVALADNRLLIGSREHDGLGVNAGAVYGFRFNDLSWLQNSKMQAVGTAAGSLFGTAVAVLGDRLLIGAPGSNRLGESAGLALVFDFNGTDWTLAAELFAQDAAPFDAFGCSVSLAADRALIGSCGDDDQGTDSGAAYLFQLDRGAWIQEAKLLAGSGVDEGAEFGSAVSLSDERALVGAHLSDVSGMDSGAAYVFELDGGSWVESAALLLDSPALYSFLGASVSLEGNRALVGAPRDIASGTSAGAAYLWEFLDGEWSSTSVLVPSDASSPGEFGDRSTCPATPR